MKTFIEIGSCDFDTNADLIKSGNWKGIMVEPAPRYNAQLSSLMQNIDNRENLSIECLAISDYDGTIEFTQSKDTSTGSRVDGLWRRGISSVTADNHKGERIFDLYDNSNWIDSVFEVPCITLDTLIEKHKVQHIDYLKIDTEGHELNILDSYSWNLKPDFIKLEHAHIDDIYVCELLKSKGYITYTEQNDIYALR